MTRKQDLTLERTFQADGAPTLDSVRPTPDATIERYRAHADWRLYYKEYVFRQLAKYAPATVCDVGCGAGEMSTEMARLGYRVTGFDISPELVAICERRAALDGVTDLTEFFVADAAALESETRTFDLVLVRGVLHHIDLEPGLDTIASLLAPNGTAIIQEPIALSATLRWIRGLLPQREELSLNERQLNRDEIRRIRARLDCLEERYFHLSARLQYLVPAGLGRLRRQAADFFRRSDHYALALFPPLKHFAGIVVLTCGKPRPETP